MARAAAEEPAAGTRQTFSLHVTPTGRHGCCVLHLGTRVALSSKFDVVVFVLAKINTRAAGNMHGVDVLGSSFMTAALLPRVLLVVIKMMTMEVVLLFEYLFEYLFMYRDLHAGEYE